MTKEHFTIPLTREFPLGNNAILNADERLIRISFSSEEPVTRASYFSEPWVEVLGHGGSEVDFARLNTGAPVLYNHDRSDKSNRIGVVERAWLEKGRGVAEIRLSKREDVNPLWQDVQDGILRNVSVSYQINERVLHEERADAPNIYRVTRWTPLEISLVDIPADPTVGVGRTITNPPIQEELPMTKETLSPEETRSRAEQEAITQANIQKLKDEVRTAERQAEKARRDGIRDAFKPFGEEYRTVEDSCLDNPDITIDEARGLLLKEIGKGKQSLAGDRVIEMGETDREKFVRAAEEAINVRAGLAQPVAGGNELRSYTLMELARRSLELSGVRTNRMDKREIVGRAFTHSTSDFSNLLANSANKSMLKGYTEAPEVFESFTRPGNLSDYKINSRVGMSEFGDLDEIKEAAEYKYGTFGERKEQIQLAKYGKLFSITREAIINDDLNAFTDIPRKMGKAARRKVGDLVFSILTSNPTMADSVALFHADHKNLAGSGGAISATTFGAGRVAMRTQTDSSGNAVLNIAPAYFVVPVALEDTARVLMTSETNPASGNSRVPNPVRGASEIVTDARLDLVSTTAWFLLADPNLFDTIEVAYLDGNPNPFLEQQDGWSVDGVDFKVRIDAAAKALDHRTFFKNAGA